MVTRLIACGAEVNQRASGRFFLPEDQKQLRNGVTNYIGLWHDFRPFRRRLACGRPHLPFGGGNYANKCVTGILMRRTGGFWVYILAVIAQISA